MKNLIALLILLLPSIVAHAQNSFTLPDLPDKYDEKACAAVIDPKSGCNTGSEPFSAFLKKFNSSVKFRATRMKCAGYVQDYLLTPELPGRKLPLFAASRPIKKNYYTLFTWAFVESDSIWFTGGYMPPFDDDGTGLSCGYHFTRTDGKWYLVYGFIV